MREDKDIIAEMELQFHEQYAKNYNSISSYVVSFVIGIVGMLVCYGITFNDLLTGIFASSPNGCRYGFTITRDMYITKELILLVAAYTSSTVVFTMIEYICIKQGWATRRDQFITFAIRRKYYKNITSANEEYVFSNNYHPFCKDKDFTTHNVNNNNDNTKNRLSIPKKIGKTIGILVGMFEYLYRCVMVALFILTVCTIGCVLLSPFHLLPDIGYNDTIIYLLTALVFLTFLLNIVLNFYWLKGVNDKYKEMEKEYLVNINQ